MKLKNLIESVKITKGLGFETDIEKDTIDNKFYRQVIYTTKHLQLVLMCIEPGDEIGEETHNVDQFIRVEQGTGKAILDGKSRKVSNGTAIIVPAGVKHNIVNTSKTQDLKLYTVYSPPQHKKDTLQKTKEDEVEDHFDDITDVD